MMPVKLKHSVFMAKATRTLHLESHLPLFASEACHWWFSSLCSWMTNKFYFTSRREEEKKRNQVPSIFAGDKSPPHYLRRNPNKINDSFESWYTPVTSSRKHIPLSLFLEGGGGWRKYVYVCIELGVECYNEDDIFIMVDTVFYSKPFGWCRRTNLSPPFFLRNESQAAEKGERGRGSEREASLFQLSRGTMLDYIYFRVVWGFFFPLVALAYSH